jgi:DNA-binding SARP family transcriptional activator
LSTLKVYLLGAARIERDGAPVEMDTRKAMALLAYLAVSGGNRQRDSLAALYWPDVDQSRARGALRRTLSTLNKALGKGYLEIDREAVAVAPRTQFWLDVAEFRRMIAGCDAHTPAPSQECPACLNLLTQGAQLYQGDFLAGFSLRDSPQFDDWQFFEGESLRRELGAALEMLSEGYGLRGDFQTAIGYARRWSAIDRLLEEAHRRLMQLYSWAGQRNAALRQYRECVRILDEELGVSPLEETTRLYQAILENRLPPPVAHPQAERGPTSSPEGHETPFSVHMVGRSLELGRLLETYAQIKTGGRFALVEGEAGIGKTRLAHEFIEHAQNRGAIIARAAAYEGEGHLAYGLFLDAIRSALALPHSVDRLQSVMPYWLSEVARLLPEIQTIFQELPAPNPLEGPGAQARFFEGLRQALACLISGQSPGVLYLDDLNWADAASIDFLVYLARRLDDTGVFILATWRNDDLLSDNPILRLVADLQRAGRAIRLPLTRLNAAQLAELVGSSQTGLAGLSELSERLYRESEGLPFFAVEYLKAIAQQGEAKPATEWNMPGSVRDLLHSRLANLDETAIQLLSSAAVFGRSFDFQLLREASGRSEMETISGLEALLRHGLVVERKDREGRGEITYDFTHEKLRQLVYEETSMTRRRLLHHRVADALVSLARRPHSPESVASQAANHYRLAGQDALAAEFYQIAGEHARALYANVEALSHFQTALALGHPDTARLHEAIGDLHSLSGEFSAALSSYENAAALSSSPAMDSQVYLATLERKIGDVHARRGEWELAECHFQSALDALDSGGDPEERARLYVAWSQMAFHSGQLAQALDLAGEAQRLAETSGGLRALAQADNILGMLARARGDFETALHFLEQSLQIAEKLDDPIGRMAALNNLALAHRDRGALDQAIALTQTALELCIQQGDRHREAALHNNLADLYHAAGQAQEAMEHLKKAVAIFALIGGGAEAMQMEIWKLVEW